MESAPVWPPAQPMYRRRPEFPLGAAILLTTLALVLIVGGFGFVIYSTTAQYRTTIHTQATVQRQLTAQVQGTATAQSQGTAQVLATAQANIDAMATTNANVSASATALADQATATVTAMQDMFTKATSGSPTLDDPLSDKTSDATVKNSWDMGTTKSTPSGCTFTDGSYQVSEALFGYFQPCFAEATNFSNFVYQVSMTVTKGSRVESGILFRATSPGTNTQGAYYFFHIGTGGSYALDLYKDSGTFRTLTSGVNSAITPGLNSSTRLAVLAQKSNLYLYVNGQYIANVNDGTLTSGKIGVAAIDYGVPTAVEFSNAKVWNS